MSRKIVPVLGMQSFYYWFDQSELIQRLGRYLDDALQDNKFYGFEFIVQWEAIDTWIAELEIDPFALPSPMNFLSLPFRQALLSSGVSSIHLPPLFSLPEGREPWLAERLGMLHALTGIRDFTVHPEALPRDRWPSLLKPLPEEVFLSVENMDKRKSEFQTLRELSTLIDRFPQLRCTFDTSHWLEIGRRLDDKILFDFFHRYRERISKIHFSVPSTVSDTYQRSPNIVTSHYLAAESGVNIPTAFFAATPGGIPWVVEGVVPAGDVELLGRELELLQFGCDAQVSQRPAIRAS